MAPPKPKKDAAPPDQEPLYPAIEGFVEAASGDEIDALFSPIREALKSLKGPRADQAKKVSKAVDRTQEVLSYLLQVREKIQADRKGRR